ncbi:hypothetical protein [Streptomyces microflavus]|uniref:hypothetical protein n=1 Tax=Streptomyces microflavus TaxID=1919 RepID=UPI0036C008D6
MAPHVPELAQPRQKKPPLPQPQPAAGLELPAFSTFDTMASTIRTEVNTSICCGIHDRMSLAEQTGMLRLLEERDKVESFNRFSQWVGLSSSCGTFSCGRGRGCPSILSLFATRRSRTRATRQPPGTRPPSELGIQPEAYDPKLDVDFTQLRDPDLTAAVLGQAA